MQIFQGFAEWLVTIENWENKSRGDIFSCGIVPPLTM
jgi:hypothetical protein